MVGELNVNQIPGAKSIYHFEDTTDTLALRNLTNNNTVTFTKAKFGLGANLGASNTNKYLSSSTNNPYSIGSGPCTVMFFVKALSEPSNSLFTLFDAQSTTTNVGIQILYNDSAGTKSLTFARVKFGVASQQVSPTIPALGLINFHHIALTYDGATVTGYLDSNPIGSVAASGDGTSGAIAGITWGINRNDATSNPASVIYEEGAVSTTALTAKQIKDYYAWAIGRRGGAA